MIFLAFERTPPQSSQLFQIIQESPAWGTNLPVCHRGYQISRKKKTMHFEPFYISKTLLYCVGPPDSKNFSFSNLFHHFLMHLYILDSPKNTSWMRGGAFFFEGGRSRGGVERANRRRYVVDCARWGRGVIRVTKRKRVPSLWHSVNPLDYAYGEHSCKKTPRLSCFVWVGSSISCKVATNVTALL